MTPSPRSETAEMKWPIPHPPQTATKEHVARDVIQLSSFAAHAAINGGTVAVGDR